MDKGFLKRISEYIWEIPQSFRSDMRVPGRVFASEKILDDILRDESLEQVVNVAALPGIRKYSLAMPDAHEGYGFCLSKDAKILTPLGYYVSIQNLEHRWLEENVKVFDVNLSILDKSGIENFFKKRPYTEVFRLTTKSGRQIVATSDHPFYTPNGMKQLKFIQIGERLAVYGFEGVPYAKPLKRQVVSDEDIGRVLLKSGVRKTQPRFAIILRKLKERNLLPLSYQHPKFPYILKIAAFILGDGTMNFIGKKQDGLLGFFGQKEDLEEVKRDLERLGYSSFGPYRRLTKTPKGKLAINYALDCSASSLVVLLEALGVPRGKKVSQSYRLPRWLFKAPLWQKRLFLASLFGCELRTPHRRLNRRGNFNAPVFPMNKSENLIRNGILFLKDIADLLSEFGVKTTKINKRRRHVAKDHLVTYALELMFSSKPQNLVNLWGKIGFEYNKKRAYLASVAVQFLKRKEILLQGKERAIKIDIPRLLDKGLSYYKIATILTGNPLGKRFILDICWKLRRGWKSIIPRVPPSFPAFTDYLKYATSGLGQSGLVWDKIVSKESIRFNDYVYDFTVATSNHNFIASGFLVSNCVGGVAAMDVKEGVISPGGIGFDINCGIRVLRSDKNYNEIKDKIPELTNRIYEEVPSGVGRSGRIKLVNKDLDDVLVRGAERMADSGYAVKEDLEHCESLGRLPGALPEMVSKTAKDRGRDQLGTMGAGNHFVEIERVDEIFDEEAARTLGLFKDQACIMIHCGSRGLGHQVATDYIQVMLRAMPKYGIKLPDNQLACAPFDSKEGQDYFAAMAGAANFAWANRQFITWEVRRAWEKVFGPSTGPHTYALGVGAGSGQIANGESLKLIYDVAHNIAKVEEYDGRDVVVHRKGATRSFPDQPVLIPGSMGTASFILVGQPKAMELSFGSCCHGAGRVMSRTAAKRKIRGSSLKEELEKKGISVRSGSMSGLAEEAPAAYKDVEEVVEVAHRLGLAKKVARLKPVGVIKG